MQLLEAVNRVNDRQKLRLGEDILRHFEGKLAGRRIAVWGIAFKPGTDDIREAPALVLVDQLLAAGAEVAVTDPQALAPGPQGAGRPGPLRDQRLPLRRERRRPGPGHRVARIPAPQPRAPQAGHAAAGRVRRAQPVGSGDPARPPASPTTASAAPAPARLAGRPDVTWTGQGSDWRCHQATKRASPSGSGTRGA